MRAFLIGAVAIVVVVGPLFLSLSVYYYDWYTHLWFIGYFQHFFQSNGVVPDTVNVQEMVLLTSPVFYAYLFYPLLGLLGTVVGVALSIRIFIVVLFVLQFYTCRRLVLFLSRDTFVANAVSVLTTWSIYPLTNLYHRAAFPELAATMLAFVNLATGIYIVKRGYQTSSGSRFDGLLFIATLLLLLGTHPITAYYYGMVFLLSMWIFWPEVLEYFKQADKRWLGLSFLLVALGLSPWLYAMAKVGDNLFYLLKFDGVALLPFVDQPWQRFSPILPWQDARVQQMGLHAVDTPFLDTQINMPLLLLLAMLGLAASHEEEVRIKMNQWFKTAYFVSVGLFIVTTLLSLPLGLFWLLPKYLRFIEYSYRMVTYQNLSIYLILAVLLSARKYDFKKGAFRVALTILILLSLISVFIKLTHVQAVKDICRSEKFAFAHRLPAKAGEFMDFPSTYTFQKHDYITPKLIPDLEGAAIRTVRFQVLEKPFGKIPPAAVRMERAGWVLTNVHRFVWNQILVDGQPLSPQSIRGSKNCMAIYLSEGPHRLEAVFRPPVFYRIAKAVSFSIAAAMVALLASGLVRLLITKVVLKK